MFKKLLSYIWIDKPAGGYKPNPYITDEYWTVVGDAMAHYCEICDRGFQNRGATKTHKRFKHKPSA